MSDRRAISLEEEAFLFHHELGAAITAWGMVESALRHLLGAMMSSVDPRTIAAGFHAIDNFRSRLKYIDNIANRELKSDTFHQHWDRLRARAESQQLRRNKLVHWVVVAISEMPTGMRVALVDGDANKSIYSIPINKKGVPSMPSGALGVRHVSAIKEDFMYLFRVISSFALSVSSDSAPPQAPLAPLAALPTIRGLVSRTYSELGLQPIPSPRKQEASR